MILGAVLAGGKARRFGSDKALAQWRGASLIDHAVAMLTPHVDRLAVCGREHGGLLALNDRPGPDLGPLGGINAALHYAHANGFDRVMTLPCDTPSIAPALFDGLRAQSSAAFVATCPVIGIWPSGLADTLDSFLAGSGDRSMAAWVQSIGACALASPALPNINRPGDLEQLGA